MLKSLTLIINLTDLQRNTDSELEYIFDDYRYIYYCLVWQTELILSYKLIMLYLSKKKKQLYFELCNSSDMKWNKC